MVVLPLVFDHHLSLKELGEDFHVEDLVLDLPLKDSPEPF